MVVNLTSDSLSEFNLTPDSFPDFYRKLIAMRFPIAVEEVLELRDLLNHSVDVFDEPTDTPQYREFKESLLTAIHSFGIENERHCQRLLSILTLFRGLHYSHSVDSRNTEEGLREEQARNRQARSRSVKYGLYSLLAMMACGIAWMGTAEPVWWIKAFTAGFAFLAWDYHHSLPALDREMIRITRQLNEMLRKRLDTLNWKTLIHKLSLILGYKQIQGVEVFQHNHAPGGQGEYRTYH